jgi:hypothetical protein
LADSNVNSRSNISMLRRNSLFFAEQGIFFNGTGNFFDGTGNSRVGTGNFATLVGFMGTIYSNASSASRRRHGEIAGDGAKWRVYIPAGLRCRNRAASRNAGKARG